MTKVSCGCELVGVRVDVACEILANLDTQAERACSEGKPYMRFLAKALAHRQEAEMEADEMRYGEFWQVGAREAFEGGGSNGEEDHEDQGAEAKVDWKFPGGRRR